MTVTVKLFGPQAQIVGHREVLLEFPVSEINCGDLRRALAGTDSRLGASLGGSRIAVNQTFAADSHPVRAGDEVALIGLIGGG